MRIKLSQLQPTLNPKRLGAAVVVSVSVLLLGFGMAFSGAQSAPVDERSEHRPAVVPVAALMVRPEIGFLMERRFVGQVESARRSPVGFESGGLLGEILVEEGDRVSAGTVLAMLDTARLDARRAQLVAGLKASEARLVLAQQTLNRRLSLVKQGAASRQGVEEARERFDTTSASVDLAQAQLDAVDVDLAKSVLTAPFNAVVTRRFMDEGRVVATGEPVMELQEIRRPEVRVGVAGPLVTGLAPGQTRTLETTGKEYAATVKAVLPTRTAGTRTVDVILTIDGNYDDLRYGDLMTLTLSEQVAASGYWLPIDALAESVRGLWTAYVLQPEDEPQDALGATHRVVPQVVEILHTASERVFVRGTVPTETLVVGTGLHRVVPGQRVRLASDAVELAQRRGDHVVN